MLEAVPQRNPVRNATAGQCRASATPLPDAATTQQNRLTQANEPDSKVPKVEYLAKVK